MCVCVRECKMQTNVQIDTKALRHSPEHGKGGKAGNRYTAEVRRHLFLGTSILQQNMRYQLGTKKITNQMEKRDIKQNPT